MEQQPKKHSKSPYVEDTFEMETRIVADLLTSSTHISLASKWLTKDMLTKESNRKIFEAIISIWEEGGDVNLTSVAEKLGGTEEVLELLNVTNGSSLGYYCNFETACVIIRTLYARRVLAAKAFSFMSICREDKTDFATLMKELDEAKRFLEDIGNVESGRAIGDIIISLADEIEKNETLHKSGLANRIPTSFESLDAATYGGFGPGNLIILAARPSVGKTALMLQMAREAARVKKSVAIYSLEMTEMEIAQRLMLSTDLVSPAEIINGNVNWDNWHIASDRISKLPISIVDKYRTLDEIVQDIIIANNKKNCDIAFIDYLGLIDVPGAYGKYTPLYQIIGKITSRLKLLAKQLSIPIVLLAQLNRATESEKRSPILSDLRDSGSIEQDADIVLMLERSVTYSNEPIIKMWLRKNRNGKVIPDGYISLFPGKYYTVFKEGFLTNDTYPS